MAKKTAKKASSKPTSHRPIVSSAHLASEGAEALSELEYGLILAHNAFSRWVQRCMAAAGHADLGDLDILVLHSLNHRDREKKVSDIAFVLGVEDVHWITYALKKLEKLGLVERDRRGKETFFETSKKGKAACMAYAKVREACLLQSMGAPGPADESLSRAADRLRALSGLYDQAARAAASF